MSENTKPVIKYCTDYGFLTKDEILDKLPAFVRETYQDVYNKLVANKIPDFAAEMYSMSVVLDSITELVHMLHAAGASTENTDEHLSTEQKEAVELEKKLGNS